MLVKDPRDSCGLTIMCWPQRSPEMGLNPWIIHFQQIFHSKPTSHWGSPMENSPEFTSRKGPWGGSQVVSNPVEKYLPPGARRFGMSVNGRQANAKHGNIGSWGTWEHGDIWFIIILHFNVLYRILMYYTAIILHFNALYCDYIAFQCIILHFTAF